ncbi:unnamed protein product [Lota lota]
MVSESQSADIVSETDGSSERHAVRVGNAASSAAAGCSEGEQASGTGLSETHGGVKPKHTEGLRPGLPPLTLPPPHAKPGLG